MNVNNPFTIKHALAFNAFFVLNYIAWLIGLQSIAPVIFTGLLIYFCYFVADSLKLKLTLPLLIILYLGLLSLGTVATSWDARSIWLFHAKRIFIDNSIFAQLDDYAIWSHNDYPVMAPLLSASFAKFIGFWNEIFPKSSNIFFILPPLLIFYGYLKSNRWFILLVVGIFYILAKLLINGYMDGILTLYALSTLVLLNQFKGDDHKNKLLLLLISLQGSVLVSIKNEGVFIFSILVFCLFVVNKRQLKYFFKQSWILLIPYIFWLIWRLTCQHFGVQGDIEEGLLANKSGFSVLALIHLINSRLTIENLTLIFQHVFTSKYYLFGLVAIVIAIQNRFEHWTNLDSLTCVFICLFFTFLTMVYLLTPYDIYWHLKGSATRTTLPIQLACFILLLNSLRQLNFRGIGRG